jgi:hypothetical protein
MPTKPNDDETVLVQGITYKNIPEDPKVNSKDFITVQEKFEKLVENALEGLKLKSPFAQDIPSKHISPNPFPQDRFNNEQIHIVETECCKKIYNTVARAMEKADPSLYLSGPSGIGKSHALAALVIRLRNELKEGTVTRKFRVIYFSNPLRWFDPKWREDYLCTEVFFALADDANSDALMCPVLQNVTFPEGTSPLLQWFYVFYQLMGAGQHLLFLTAWLDFEKKLALYLEPQGIKLVSICDDENRFQVKEMTFPWNRRILGDIKILAASSNNDLSFKIKGFEKEYFFETLTILT